MYVRVNAASTGMGHLASVPKRVSLSGLSQPATFSVRSYGDVTTPSFSANNTTTTPLTTAAASVTAAATATT